MPCKRKEQSPSTCTHTSRRILESLPIKDLPQAIVDHFPNSLNSSSSKCGQPVSDRDDCSPVASCTSHHRRENRRLRPQRQSQATLICTPQCKGKKGTAMLDELQQCRANIEALARKSRASSAYHDDCGFDRTGKKKNRKANCKNIKKAAPKNCCQEKIRKKNSDNISFEDCVCPKSETKKRNKVHTVSSVGNQYSCQEIKLVKKSSDKNTSCFTSSVDYDCECEKEMIKQYKAYYKKKVKHDDSCNCFQKILGIKTNSKDTCCAEPAVVDECICAEEMEKRNKANKIDTAVSAKSCQVCGKTSSHEDICCVEPVLVDECICAKEMEKRNKANKIDTSGSAKSCQVCGKTSSHENTCCVEPVVVDEYICAEVMEKRNKPIRTDTTGSAKSCQVCGKTSSHEDTCCVEPVVVDECICAKEMEKRNKANMIDKAGSAKSCQVCDKTTSNKDTCCVEPTVVDEYICDEVMEKRNKPNKVDTAASVKYCQIRGKTTSNENTCCAEPTVVDECIFSTEEMKKQPKANKVDTGMSAKSCRLCGIITSDKEISCCLAPKEDNDCLCDEKKKKRQKVKSVRVNDSDIKPCCQKLFKKKTSFKDTCCCFPSEKDDDCDCEEEKKNRNREVNFDKVVNSDSQTCEELNKKETSDKATCCCFPSRVVDVCDCDEDLKKESAKVMPPLIANTCGYSTCAVNTCECRLPSGYPQYFNCTGQMNGSCRCDKNNS